MQLGSQRLWRKALTQVEQADEIVISLRKLLADEWR